MNGYLENHTGFRIEPWIHRIWRECADGGDAISMWVRQDGLGRWLVTRSFDMSPQYYLNDMGYWVTRATPDTRHDERTARRLAIEALLDMECNR